MTPPEMRDSAAQELTRRFEKPLAVAFSDTRRAVWGLRDKGVGPLRNRGSVLSGREWELVGVDQRRGSAALSGRWQGDLLHGAGGTADGGPRHRLGLDFRSGGAHGAVHHQACPPTPPTGSNTTFSRDGRFLFNQQTEGSANAPITLLLNWRPK